MKDLKHTPGPWQWAGNAKTREIYLTTTHSGRLFVMDFARWGMNAVQPLFRPLAKFDGMLKAVDLVTFEVGENGVTGYKAAQENGSVYRYQIEGINHPDAKLIAAAPELLEALIGVVAIADRATVEFDKAKAAIAKATGNTTPEPAKTTES